MDDPIAFVLDHYSHLQQATAPVSSDEDRHVIEAAYADGVAESVKHVLIGDPVPTCAATDLHLHNIILSY